MFEGFSVNRRRFLGSSAIAIATDGLGMMDSTYAGSSDKNATKDSPIKPQASTTFGPLKHIHEGVLDVGYAEASSYIGQGAKFADSRPPGSV